MTSKIAAVANLALHVFQPHSSRSINVLTSATTTTPSGTDNEHTSAPPRMGFTQPPLDRGKSPLQLDALHLLTNALRALTTKDIGLDPKWISDTGSCAAPVVYVHIMENEIFSMGIFVLRPGSRIPLHDHPGMYGALQVIHGALRCRSFSHLDEDDVRPTKDGVGTINTNMVASELVDTGYSADSPLVKLAGSKWQLSDVIPVHPYQDIVLTTDSQAHFVAPMEGNFHEITPVDGPAVFLDILAPPYDHDLGTRECRFYKEIILPSGTVHSIETRLKSTLSGDDGSNPVSMSRPSSETDGNQPATTTPIRDSASHNPIVYLLETNQPKDYWCESAEYVGPSLV